MTTLHEYLHTFQHAYQAQFTEHSSKKAIFWRKDVEKKETHILHPPYVKKQKKIFNATRLCWNKICFIHSVRYSTTILFQSKQ